MELVLSSLDIDPLPEGKKDSFECNNEGLLVSSYKEETKQNFFHSKPTSVFGIKQRIKSAFYKKSIGIDTALKVSVFLIAFLVALS